MSFPYNSYGAILQKKKKFKWSHMDNYFLNYLYSTVSVSNISPIHLLQL